MKKLMIKVYIVIIIFFGVTALYAITATLEVKANIRKLFTFSEINSLNFGDILLVPGIATQVSITEEGLLVVNGATVNRANPGYYRIFGGNENSNVRIIFDSVVISDNTTVLNIDLDKRDFLVALDSSGEGTFRLGGKLNIPSNVRQGYYSGRVTVRIEYE